MTCNECDQEYSITQVRRGHEQKYFPDGADENCIVSWMSGDYLLFLFNIIRAMWRSPYSKTHYL